MVAIEIEVDGKKKTYRNYTSSFRRNAGKFQRIQADGSLVDSTVKGML